MQTATANLLLSETGIRGNISMIDRETNMVCFCPADVVLDYRNMVLVSLSCNLDAPENAFYPDDLKFHFAVYRHLSHVRAVAHVFPEFSCALGNEGKGVAIYEESSAAAFPGPIPCICLDGSDVPGRLYSEEINKVVSAANLSDTEESGALLISRFGALVWDYTPHKAFDRVQKLEAAARSAYLSTLGAAAKEMAPARVKYCFEAEKAEKARPSQGTPGFPVTVEERKKISLEMLVYFDRICRENGVHYSITGGTLLGAVRHGGFIPWDDDVDVFMTRPEYEKIRELLPDDARFVLFDRRKVPDYDFIYGRLLDTQTIITESPGTLNAGTGVFLDICIVDGLPKNKLLCSMHIKYMWILTRARLYSRRSVSINEPTLMSFKKHGRVGRYCRLIIVKLLRRFTTHNYWNRRMEKVVARYPFEKSNYVGNFSTQYGKKEKLKKSVFDSYIDIEFEGCRVMACEQYEKYLVSIYGDYSNLPAINKRLGHHPGTVYWV